MRADGAEVSCFVSMGGGGCQAAADAAADDANRLATKRLPAKRRCESGRSKVFIAAVHVQQRDKASERDHSIE